jgi:hypothetical protein
METSPERIVCATIWYDFHDERLKESALKEDEDYIKSVFLS